MSNKLHSIVDHPYGFAFKVSNFSCTLHVANCDFERVAVHFNLEQPPLSLVVENCVSEQYKKLVYGLNNGANQTLAPIRFSGGRYSPGGVAQASEGDLAFPASDMAAFDIGGSSTLTLESIMFNDSYSPMPNWRVRVRSNDIVSKGCIYPNLTPFDRSQGNLGTGKEGRTFSQGDTGPSAASNQMGLPTLNGCQSSGGTFTIRGPYTTPVDESNPAKPPLPVTFPSPESPGALNYKVRFSVVSATAGALVSTPYASGKSATQFLPTVAVSPGASASASVTYEYELWRA